VAVVWALVLILVGFVLLYYGGDWLVIGAVRLAARLGVAPVVIGLTVVAFGTSVPELLVTMLSAVQGHNAVAVGNILGSDIFNICLIVGLSAILANPLEGSPAVARRDMYVLMGSMVLFGLLGRDLVFTSFDGVVLAVLFTMYLLGTVKYPGSDDPEAEILEALEEIDGDGVESDIDSTSVTAHLAAEPFTRHLVAGLVLLPLGAELLVRGGVALATMAGISERFIAMTLVSWGTSLPEMATSLAAAYRGHAGLCIGNIVGSNIFNTVAIMGITAIVTPVTLSPESFRFDFVLACVATLLLAVLHRGGRTISRTGGAVLLVCFSVMFVLLSF